MFTKLITRSSAAADWLHADLITGEVMVKFNNGVTYNYTNVSRRAIINLMMNDNMSTGFWINQNLLNSDRVRLNWQGADLFRAAVAG